MTTKDLKAQLDHMVESWRQERDRLFQHHGLDKDQVYAEGEFEALPPDLLMAVCYVDAYVCVQNILKELT